MLTKPLPADVGLEENLGNGFVAVLTNADPPSGVVCGASDRLDPTVCAETEKTGEERQSL